MLGFGLPSRVLPLASPSSTTEWGPNPADTTWDVDLIEFPPDKNPYESLKEPLTELHTLNLFQMY